MESDEIMAKMNQDYEKETGRSIYDSLDAALS
jgi:hypothetical protein